MKKTLLICFFFSQIIYCQFPDISFNGSNAWSTNANIAFDIANNQATVNGNGTNFVKTELTTTLTTIPNEFYFVAEVFLSNVVYNPENIKNPQLVVREDTGSLVGRINLDAGLENQWFTTGIRIRNYSSTTLKLEFGINNTTGTMLVKNPALVTTPPTFTYEFPFAIPTDVTASLQVDLNQKHLFNNDLLSTNSHFVYASYQWGNSNLNTAINTYFPMSNIRFPGGTVGNYYNYQTDTFYLNGNTPNNLTNFANNGYTFNYSGYKDLVINSGATATLMFNVLTNTPAESQAEYQNRLASGLPIKWIEMGNEMYASGNQTGNITDVSSYITHTQQMATAIKSVNPNAKVAVCLEKEDFENGSWNEVISEQQTYFDAATLHNYIAVGTYFYSKYDSYSMFNSYKVSMKRFTDYATLFPNKPLLLTEWGITTETDPPYFIQTLGIADTFLAIEKANQLGIVEQAGIHMLYKNDENSEATLMFKGTGNQIRLTSKGVVYAKLFEVFQNAEVYDAAVTSASLESNLQAIYGKMVKKGNQYKIFAVNKLPVASPFQLQVNGTNYSGNYTLETYTATLSSPVNDVLASSSAAVWNTVSSSGAISLPPSSICVVTISENDLNAVLEATTFATNEFNITVFPNPTNGILEIQNNSLSENTYELYDCLGKKVTNYTQLSNTKMDVSQIPAGIYFLKISTNNTSIIVKKIVKN